MHPRQLWLAVVLCAAVTSLRADCEQPRGPCIYEGGIVNGASFAPAAESALSPNTIISIFGVNLSLRTWGVAAGDIVGNELPKKLSGVSVIVGQPSSSGPQCGGQLAPLFFVSPGQINAQLPSGLRPGQWVVCVNRENLYSNVALVKVSAVSPGLFPVFAHPDWSVVGWGIPDGATPARPGGAVASFGTGFGPTSPGVASGVLPNFAAPLLLEAAVRWDGRLLPAPAVLFAGQAPWLAGVCQVNFTVPDDATTGNHEVQIEIDGKPTQHGIFIAVERPLADP